MSLNLTARRATPVLLRLAQGNVQARSRLLSRHTSAIAILVPHRGYASRPVSTQNESGTGAGARADLPPPGFSTKDAQRQPVAGDGKQGAVSSPSPSTAKAESKDEGKATAEPKQSQSDRDTQDSKQIAAEKASAQDEQGKQVAEKKKEEAKKLTLGQKIKREAAHYWDGTKLLATEVKISSRLALKMAAGYELTRREDRQLHRTVKDLGRLVPFSVFVIVPFAELLLPIALKLFPNLLPSTYEGEKTRTARAKNLRATRNQVSETLRKSLSETGLPVRPSGYQKEEFVTFFRKVRTTGECPTKEDVIKVCRAFKDDITLDNLSRAQLVGICRYMNLTTFGTDNILRYQIRHQMRQIKRDDRAISYEGVDSLSVPELHVACASRGIPTHGVSPGHLRDDLQMWLDLRLKYGVPSTLLVLSNAYVYSAGFAPIAPNPEANTVTADGKPIVTEVDTKGENKAMHSQLAALTAVLSSISEELFHAIELEVHTAEGAATNKQRLEVLKEQQEMIEEENAQSDEVNAGSGGGSSVSRPPKDDKDIDENEDVVDQHQTSESSSETGEEPKKVEASKSGQETDTREVRKQD